MNRPIASPRTPLWLRVILTISAVVTLCLLSFCLVTNTNALQIKSTGDLSTLLFGASSVALIGFSLIAAVLALFGWRNLQDTIHSSVEEATREKIGGLENELRGRVHTILGYMIGEMGIDQGSLKVIDKDRVTEAVDLCKQGHRYLTKVGGAAEYLSLNNLVYYAFMLEDESQRDFLLMNARLLKSAGERHQAKDLLLTAYGVILRYGSEKQEREQAGQSLHLLLKSPNLSEKQRREAKKYLGLASL